MRFHSALLLILTTAVSAAFGEEPLALNVDNPHYF